VAVGVQRGDKALDVTITVGQRPATAQQRRR